MDYSHSYEHPRTGRLIDVLVPDWDEDADDEDDIRNARGRSRSLPGLGRSRDRGRGRGRVRRPGGGQRVGPRRPMGQLGPWAGSYGPMAPAPINPYGPPAVGPVGPVVASGDHITIRKSAFAELIPAIGMVWASFLGRPEQPKAVGDPIVDLDNASAHRDALARHSQNQTRILALSELAERAIKLFTDEAR